MQLFGAFRTVNAPGAILYQKPTAGDTAADARVCGPVVPPVPVTPILPFRPGIRSPRGSGTRSTATSAGPDGDSRPGGSWGMG